MVHGSQLQELQLNCIAVSIGDLMVLPQRCRHSLQGFKIETMRMNANVEDCQQLSGTKASLIF